jgi:endonuclease-8
MPEGDTIWRAAHTLNRALATRQIVRARSAVPSVRAERLVGARVNCVEARGKHLLIVFEDGRALHSHMRMHGSWHLYRPGERWQAPAFQARCVLETDAFVAVCFRAPLVEVLSPSALAQHPLLSGLGPDLLNPAPGAEPSEQPDLFFAAVLERFRAHSELAIGEALLAQNLAAGIGNVYKSEALFLCGLSPFVRVAALEDAALRRLIETAQRLMRENLSPAPRRTRHALGAGPRYWVYRRSGKPCARCGTLVKMQRQGAQLRSTYYCPECQPAPGAA